ncbi:glycosyl transferase family 11 [Curtobacterium sp. PhB42]|nr:glycosyl transferase family 11 [Curtobacterium sp. PhB191]TDW39170.1 glycosyl transferase family 11 [Curtobacterium sp. PhB42]TDW50762.1 glycosyl transferase family 11 [Curtobacterium sp. PhB190]
MVTRLRDASVLWAQGGLGNQLFQLNAGLTLSEHPATLLVSGSSFGRDRLRQFELGALLPSSALTSSREDFRLGQPYDWRGRRRSKTRDRSLTTVFSDPETLPSAFRPGTFNIGFFQDAASLALPTDATTALLAAYRNAVSAGSASANRPVLHVRRGDYTTSPAAQRTFGTLSRRYYDDACRALGIPIDESIIFTDDPAAVEREFDVPRSNIIGPEDIESPLDTLVAMSRASALVIPNSTFSWWAAELASHVPVAAPSTWFFDRPGNLRRTGWVSVPNA